MKLLATVAVIALASATAAFADSGSMTPTNLNSANQNAGSSMPKSAPAPAMSQKPSQQGAIDSKAKSAPIANKDSSMSKDKMAKSSISHRGMSDAQQDRSERAQTQQLNEQQLASGSGMINPAAGPAQTANRPPEDNKMNCIEGTMGCTPAIPQTDH